ncbi:MAG: hypothetical protein ACLP7Q_15725 [Isosphaeraceae bacterium]
MQRLVVAILLAVMMAAGVWAGGLKTACGAAPAPTSYAAVEKKIASVRESWARPDAPQVPNAPGWNALFDALLDDLRAYSQARDQADRLEPLNRIYQISSALAPVPWLPAMELREELRQWLRPRVRLAWAERRLDETLRNLPHSSDPAVNSNRQRWADFVGGELGQALAQYNAATTVAQRQEGLRKVHEALRSLQTNNGQRPWQPSWDLQAAFNDLFNQPNLDVTADLSVVAPVFDQNLVTSGPVYRKGYWSQVTAGPKTGFGLLPSDDGIAFYNSQMLTSVTPITDFQNQIASDPRGQRATKLYGFSATTCDYSQLTIYAVLRTSGLSLAPAYNHSIDAAVCSTPAAGGGFGRLIAGLIGMNQNKITQKVYEGAVGNFRQRIPQEALEEAQERIAGQAASRNAELGQYLIGSNMLAFQDFLISGLSLRSRPDAVYVGGLLQSREGDRQRGADAPQPSSLLAPGPGLTADLHLTSVLNSVADSLFRRPDVQTTENIMLLTKDVPPGTAPREGATIRRNVDFNSYSQAVDEAARANNPKVSAIRLMRPAQPPEFAADARGYLVVLFKDVQFEVPAPDKSTQAGSVIGVPARILRIKIPQLELAFSHQIESPTPGSHVLRAKLEDFWPSPSSQVLAITNDESKLTPLTRFSGALVISAMAARLRNLPLVANLDNLNLRGFSIQSASPLDPSGWMRLNLVRTAPVYAAPVETAASPPQTVYYYVPTGTPVTTAATVETPVATPVLPAQPVVVAQ